MVTIHNLRGIQSELNIIITELNHDLAEYKHLCHDINIGYNNDIKQYELQIKVQLRDDYRNEYTPFIYRYNDNITIKDNVKQCIQEYMNMCFEKNES